MPLPSRKIWPANMGSLYEAMSFVSFCAGAGGIPPGRISELEIALEEVLVNIFKYAYPGEKEGDVEISCGEAEGNFVVEIVDSGIPFDILAAADPDTTAGIDERSVGGLGIFFVKQLIDEVKYCREGERNKLTLAVLKKNKPLPP